MTEQSLNVSLGSRDMVDSFRVQVASAKALLTDDILRDIFLHLDSRLARVCKFFSEPALDLLWKDLSDVFLLLRILPSFVDSDGQK
ncbi:hypothetical protein B0H21DRAFT_757823, partial [Amylocystis lapponica]